ncbi:GGDEF domain-containing protein [Colwellia psychrerythraea]|uniref:diguanylate cyclase n=1 Tax=Colwellia psychrerythraea TaxID=28229 RepID=A0A099KE55_COLPS|nr:GGDEF domain-containing protein [Colwellia psychrerythraea]KGJ89039.1 diguanylate cyclase [Colwellia psychrerythraea]
MKIFYQSMFFILLILVPFVQAQEAPSTQEVEQGRNSESSLLHIPVISLLPINSNLLTLLTLLHNKSINNQEVDRIFAQLTLSKSSFNAAEQYLLLVAQALLRQNVMDETSIDGNKDKVQSTAITSLLAQADELSEHISEQQLSQPNFLQLPLMLSEYYAQQGEFDLAYLQKKSYLKKYYIYRKSKRLAMIASLEQSFEIKDKKASNSLLASQNELNVRRVEQVQDQKASHKYNFTIIISTAIVFVLLFFRQLIIRNKLIHLTRTDALTGLANRSALFEHGELTLASFVDKPEELSVLMLDLDHFKRINDNFGHQVGDKILKVVSQLVNETMRSRDVFYRLGGEEFVAILPFSDSNKAKAIAVRINEKIAQHDFSFFLLKGQVTVSIGVATMGHKHKSFDEVLHNADLAMYQAKERGRNNVVCYQSIAKAQERRGN